MEKLRSKQKIALAAIIRSIPNLPSRLGPWDAKASSSAQLGAWLREMGALISPIQTIVPGLPVEGPCDALAPHVKELHRRFHRLA